MKALFGLSDFGRHRISVEKGECARLMVVRERSNPDLDMIEVEMDAQGRGVRTKTLYL